MKQVPRTRISTGRDLLRSQSVVRKRRKKKLIRLYGILALGLFAVGGLAYASHMDNVQIRKVVVVGNETVPGDEIERVSNVILDASYMGVFPKRNSLIFPKDQLSKALVDTFPKIESLDMETESFNYLNVRIKERAPFAEWCSALECYLVDENAYIFAAADGSMPTPAAKVREKRDDSEGTASNASSSSPDENAGTSTEGVSAVSDGAEKPAAPTVAPKSSYGPLLRISGLDESVGSKPVGKTLMPQELLRELKDMAVKIESFKLKVREIEHRGEDEIVFKIEGNGRIIFNQRRPLTQSYENLATALKSDVFTSATATFEYIDTRFGNKVFYKFRK
ncbi:MAG TPA: hypothetical protein VGE62_01895 [Candidatus Paceibacterota bacterium]